MTIYTTATGLVVYSRIERSNIVDNAYGVINVAADGTTARRPAIPRTTGLNPPGTATCSRPRTTGGACDFNSVTNPGPAISPTTNPQVPENPVNGAATVETSRRPDDLQRGRLLPVPQRAAVGPDQRRSSRS